jgi:hypothetical protein
MYGVKLLKNSRTVKLGTILFPVAVAYAENEDLLNDPSQNSESASP